jgi:hypothetical protein
MSSPPLQFGSLPMSALHLSLSSIDSESPVGEAMEVSVNATPSSNATIADSRPQLELSRAEILTLRHQAAAFSSAPPLPRHVPVTLTGTMTISSGQLQAPKFAGALKPKSGGILKRSHRGASTELTYFGNTVAEQADLKAKHACYRCHHTGHAFGPACPEFASGLKSHASLAGRQPKGPLKAALFQK